MRKAWILTLSALAVLLAAYFGSACLFLGSLPGAFRSGDATTIEDRVDFPAVRQSLKGQLSAVFTRKFSSDPEMTDNPFKGLGMLFGPVMIERMVDAYCTPDYIAAYARRQATGDPNPPQPTPNGGFSTVPGPALPPLPRFDPSNLGQISFPSLGTFQFKANQAQVTARLEGWSWKIVRVELPANLFDPEPDKAALDQ
jgi:hypothetical protein